MPSLRDLLIGEGLEPNRRLLQQKIDETKTMIESNQNNQSQQSPSKSAAEPESAAKKEGDDAKDVVSPRGMSKSTPAKNGANNKVADAGGNGEDGGEDRLSMPSSKKGLANNRLSKSHAPKGKQS